MRIMRIKDQEAIAKFTRGSFAIGTYRWFIEVALLFAAFNEFPDHKWSIGLALLTFNGGIRAVIHVFSGLNTSALAVDFYNNRKTLNAIALAAEYSNAGNSDIDQETFLEEVRARVEQEYTSWDETGPQPTPTWMGVLLAIGALFWELAASLFGIGLVAALTS